MLALNSQIRKIGNFENMSRKSQGHSSNSLTPLHHPEKPEKRQKVKTRQGKGVGGLSQPQSFSEGPGLSCPKERLLSLISHTRLPPSCSQSFLLGSTSLSASLSTQ